MFRRLLEKLGRLRGLRADGAALALGSLAALALPPVNAVPLLLLCFPGLLALLDAAPGPLVAARRGWWFGFGLHVFGLYWVTEAILVEAARFWWLVPFAVPALAATLALFIAVATAIARLARPGWRRVLALAGAWVLLDLARQFVATGFPWNLLGSVWEAVGTIGDVYIQPAAWIGIHGLTLATVLLACVPVLSRRWQLAGLGLFLAWTTAGILRLQAPLPPAPDLTVALIQGNVAQGQKWNRSLVIGIFERYLRLTQEAVAKSGTSPLVVVWPETASPFLLERDPAARQAIQTATGGHPSLIGSVRFAANGRPLNSLFALTDEGDIAGMYDKWHLVPFGEYQPDWLPIGIQVVPGGGFARGPGPRTLHVPGLPPVGPLICYEAIFPAEGVDRQDRPAWLVNVTNDAWFGNSTGPRQHLAAARMRAVEEGLPLLRAANTGISAGFDARGHELARLGMQKTGVLTIHLPAALPAPLFARFGLLIPGFLALVVAAAGLLLPRIARDRN